MDTELCEHPWTALIQTKIIYKIKAIKSHLLSLGK